MATCEYASSCFFFTRILADMPNTAEFFRSRFCGGEFTRCDRFVLSRSVGVEKVPDDLLPLGLRGSGCFCGW